MLRHLKPDNARLFSLLGLLIIGSLPVTTKYGGLPLTIVYSIALVVAGMVIATCGCRTRRSPGRWQAGGVALGLIVAFAVLYPVAQSGLLGPGSDRDEALSIAIQALLDGRFPYQERTSLGGLITPLPGALLIGAPFHLLGAVAIQNIAVTLGVAFAMSQAMTPQPARWLTVGLVTLGNPGFMQDYATGGDYAINALYVGACLWIAVREVDRGTLWRMTAAATLLGMAVCSRPIYLVAVVILAGHGWRRHGPGTGLLMLAVTAGVAASLALPFALHNFAEFSPLHITSKLPQDARYLGVLSPLLAVVVAACLCDRPLSCPIRLFAVLGVSVGVMLLPTVAALMWHVADIGLRAWARPLAYAQPAILYGCAALMMEPDGETAKRDRQPFPPSIM